MNLDTTQWGSTFSKIYIKIENIFHGGQSKKKKKETLSILQTMHCVIIYENAYYIYIKIENIFHGGQSKKKKKKETFSILQTMHCVINYENAYYIYIKIENIFHGGQSKKKKWNTFHITDNALCYNLWKSLLHPLYYTDIITSNTKKWWDWLVWQFWIIRLLLKKNL